MTSRHYCFTAWQKPTYDETRVRYLCYAEEKAPSTGKLHYQGYIEFFGSHRYPGAKKILGDPTANLSERRGSREQAISYCRGEYTTVDGRYKPANPTFVEFGSTTRKKPVSGTVSESVLPDTPMRQCDNCSQPSRQLMCGSCMYTLVMDTKLSR